MDSDAEIVYPKTPGWGINHKEHAGSFNCHPISAQGLIARAGFLRSAQNDRVQHHWMKRQLNDPSTAASPCAVHRYFGGMVHGYTGDVVQQEGRAHAGGRHHLHEMTHPLRPVPSASVTTRRTWSPSAGSWPASTGRRINLQDRHSECPPRLQAGSHPCLRSLPPRSPGRHWLRRWRVAELTLRRVPAPLTPTVAGSR